MVNNSLAKKQTKTTFSAFLAKDAVKNQINSIVGGKDGQRFISAIVSAVSVNPALQECDNSTILSGALLGESLKLSPSPQLGYYYLVPFNDKERGKVATFQLGYKGYIQLAIRSKQYKKLNVMAIKEGELEYFDPLNEDIKINLMVDDWDAREEAPTVGYYAFFELLDGFRKAIYWSKKQMIAHADKFSPAFSKDATTIKVKGAEKAKVSFADYEAGNYDPRDAWMYSSFWYKNFDSMAYKTMLRHLLSKWGPMSTELQQAFSSDMTFENADGSRNYVETEEDVIDIDPAEPVQSEQEQQNESEQAAEPAQDVAFALFGNQ
jgi:recombination protein RecT|nr:MAG TPA: RecT protein [Caudoviricetes sp.]